MLATSEAGLLPLYSNWKSIDAWGLNDEWIAHNGEITAQYLEAHKPDLIVFHAYFSPLLPARLSEKNLQQDWFRMTITLKDYAESHGYILAAAFGDSPYETHYYYVRPDFPDSEKNCSRNHEHEGLLLAHHRAQGNQLRRVSTVGAWIHV